ncbi:MAG: sulfite exporter TauE/SafE family protein [Vicinamibacterales bacterium]
MTPLAAALAIAIGAVMGLLGGGGSILAVPALTLLLHFTPKEAIVISLSVVAIAATAGAVGSFIRGTLPLSDGLIVGLAATAGAAAGGFAGAQLADATQLRILGVVMLLASTLMFFPPIIGTAPAERRSMPRLLLLGVPLGMLTGLIGVGGGFLIVPALVLVAHLPMREAAGASLVVMAMAAMSGLAGYLGQTPLALSFIVPFALLAALGTLAGGMAAHHLPHRRLQQVFAATLVVLGSYVLIRS